MKTIYNFIKQRDFLKHNTIFFIGTLCIAFFNYLYYPVLSRIVSVADFGEIQAVISLFMQLGIVLTAFGYVVTNITGNTEGHERDNILILQLEKLMLAATLVLFVVLALSSYIFKDSFKLGSTLPVLLVGILIIINVPATSRTYILQGMKRLREVAVGGVIFAAGKLLITVALVYLLTESVVAAVCGYIVAQVVMLYYLQRNLGKEYVLLLDLLRIDRTSKMSQGTRRLVWKELRFGLIIAIILAGLALLYTSDTVIARLFFDTHTLGLYSGISSVARIVFFVTASVAGVLIASIRINEPTKVNIAILVKSLIIILCVGGGVAAFMAAFPGFTTSLLVGEQYTAASGWLAPLALVMLLCSINNLLAIYQISLRKYFTAIPITLGCLALIAGLALYHETVKELILVYMIANAVILVLLSVQIFLGSREKVEI